PIAVTARADAAGDHDRSARTLELAPELCHQLYRCTVYVGKLGPRIADLFRPVAAGAPGRTLQNEARAVVARNREIAAVIAFQARTAFDARHLVEGGEIGEGDTIMEDKGRLQPAVGQEELFGKLRQGMSVTLHCFLIV